MKDSMKDGATARAVATSDGHLERPAPPRPRLETLVGLAPAAPIVTGDPERDAAASAPAAAEVSQEPPESRVQATRGSRPEPPRASMPSKHTLDAIAINAEAAAAAEPPRRRGRVAAVAALLVVAALALVGARRMPLRAPVLGAEPPFVASVDLPPVAPVSLVETSADDEAQTPRVAARTNKVNAKPVRKAPARHKRAPKS